MISPVDIVELMHRIDCQNHLSQVKSGHVLWQTVLKLAEKSQEVTTHVVIHHQVLQKTDMPELNGVTADRHQIQKKCAGLQLYTES